MTVRRPFQRLLAALAIASGTAAYGATAQQSPLQPVDSFQTPNSLRDLILASEPADSMAVQLLAQRGERGGGGGRSGGDSGSRGSSGGSSSRGSSGPSGGSSSRGSSGPSGGSSSRGSSGPSAGPSSRGSSGPSSGGSSVRSSGGPTIRSQAGDSGSRGSSTPRIQTPRVEAPRSAPRVDTPRIAPRTDAPRVQTPRVETPRVQTPRVDTPRVQTPRNDAPRVDTPRNNAGDNIPRSINRGSDNTPRVQTPNVDSSRGTPPRIENRNNAGGSSNIGGNRVEGNLRNNNSADTNRRGDTGAGSSTRTDSSVRTPRSNTLPNLGNRGNDTPRTDSTNDPAARIRDNADRLRDNANRVENRGNDGTSNAADRIRENADRLRDNADRTPGRTNDATNTANDRLRENVDRLGNQGRTNDATERMRERDGNRTDGVARDGNPIRDADRVNRDNLDPKLRNALDRARDNRENTPRDGNRPDGDRNNNNNDRDRGNLDNIVRDGNRGRDNDGRGNAGRDNDARDNLRDVTRPIAVRPDRIDADVRNRINERERIVIRDNDRTINLSPINRPGLGRSFGRDNLVDRRVALNGLLHQSRVNRNVRYNGRFNDWHAWNGNNFSRHNNWHRGYWNFNRWNGAYGRNWWGFGIGIGGGWGGGWGGRGGWGGGWGGWGGGWGYPVAASFGLSPWGMNYVGYNFGLYDYYNPYCFQPVPFYGGYSYDYTQPLIVNNYDYSNPGVVSSGAVVQNVEQQPQQAEPDMALFDQARSAFYSGNYAEALRLTEQQIQQTPKDSILHEFRGLVLFALGRFEDAAIPVYAVLAVGPGWDWETMSSLYSNVDVYASQLKALEDFHRANPDVAYASFLLGYQYLTCGHTEAAAAQFDNVLRINPQDLVATRLLQALGDGTTRTEEEMPMAQDDNTALAPLNVPEVPELPPAAMVKPEDLHGTWQAQSSKGKTFTLTLTQDGTFEWVSKDGTKSVDQKGVFGVEGETLAMEPDGGGVLVGKVSKPENGTFKLELVGGLPDDAALEFKMVNK